MVPTAEESQAIDEKTASDPDDFELDDAWFEGAKPSQELFPEAYGRAVRQKDALKAGLIRRDLRDRTPPAAAGAYATRTGVRKQSKITGIPTKGVPLMTRYLAFDIETTKPFPEDHNWRSIRPLGIACAAACGGDDPRPRAWYHRSPSGDIEPTLTRQQAQSLVKQLITLTDPQQTPNPFTLLTWERPGL